MRLTITNWTPSRSDLGFSLATRDSLSRLQSRTLDLKFQLDLRFHLTNRLRWLNRNQTSKSDLGLISWIEIKLGLKLRSQFEDPSRSEWQRRNSKCDFQVRIRRPEGNPKLIQKAWVRSEIDLKVLGEIRNPHAIKILMISSQAYRGYDLDLTSIKPDCKLNGDYELRTENLQSSTQKSWRQLAKLIQHQVAIQLANSTPRIDPKHDFESRSSCDIFCVCEIWMWFDY